MKSKPEYLYHYTSIETLALILSTKKIRFNALNQVDDLDEGKCLDFKFISKYFFVSCWTSLEEESLPFWNMYTPNMKGIRIKMPYDFFNTNDISTKGIYGLAEGHFKSIVSQEETFQNNYWIVPTQNEYLFDVDYTSDNKKLFPQIETINGDSFNINLNKIGIYKSLHWKFQSEWRYIIKIMPTSSRNPAYYSMRESNIMADSIYSMRKGDKLPFSSYLVDIDKNKIENMEILLGPKHTTSEKLIVESLVKNFNPKAEIRISCLHNKIR
ncbi:hypothetical protein HUW51_17415 [Adhaeribacter swui]|uniref:DUF2971 domain-containing protein n=1 Tax=Adhaeribacter swui TaxID=2086471 RepID=A0A7G7GB81_9BACT|nr:DUF2971 domain-containing protein [Adhaeribacter swui]QNF34415.1 hypothetical protein HUW51_17415 [Adhaeribacter swui]